MLTINFKSSAQTAKYQRGDPKSARSLSIRSNPAAQSAVNRRHAEDALAAQL